jgi:DtxR family Mn-dependent transcriptional regulator
MASPTEENYLKALFNLANEQGEINATDLSSILQVSTPTVNSMVRNLCKQGLVNYEKYKPISLTAKGKREAALVIRKHRLTEMYLVEKMGFGWEMVHEIAEQIEHIKSPVFFDRMD